MRKVPRHMAAGIIIQNKENHAVKIYGMYYGCSEIISGQHEIGCKNKSDVNPNKDRAQL
jgi:hypothetical protein